MNQEPFPQKLAVKLGFFQMKLGEEHLLSMVAESCQMAFKQLMKLGEWKSLLFTNNSFWPLGFKCVTCGRKSAPLTLTTSAAVCQVSLDKRKTAHPAAHFVPAVLSNWKRRTGMQ